MRITSFGKSFIECYSRANASQACANAILAAAAKRWPDGWIDPRGGNIRYMVPGGLNGSHVCGILIDNGAN
jgi:hypothetical protein